MFHRKLSFIIEMIREEDEEGVEHLRCVAGWKEIPRSSLLEASANASLRHTSMHGRND